MMYKNWELFKVPLGFVRLLEIPFILLACLPVSRFASRISYHSSCNETEQTIEFAYPFRFSDVQVSSNSCDLTGKAGQHALFAVGESFAFSSTFFVTVGYLSLILVTIAIIVYLFMWHNYEQLPFYAAADFCATTLFAALWLLSSVGWAFTISEVKHHMEEDYVYAHLIRADAACKERVCAPSTGEPCDPKRCQITDNIGFAAINVSVLAGLACVLLFMGNMWFVLKETMWYQHHRARGNLNLSGAPNGAHMMSSPPGDDLDQLEFDDSIYD